MHTFGREGTKPKLKGQGRGLIQAIHLLNQGVIRSGKDNCNGWALLREELIRIQVAPTSGSAVVWASRPAQGFWRRGRCQYSRSGERRYSNAQFTDEF